MTPKTKSHTNKIPAGGAGHATTLAVFLGLLVVHLVVASFFISNDAPGTDAAWTGFPLDDAWIHMVYSRSLAESGLPCYNDGVPENGFTSPLWMIAGAVPQLCERFLGISAVAGTKVLGLLFGWLAACAMTALLLGAGGRLQSAVFGGLLVAASPVMVFAGLSGMEVTLTVFVLLGAFCAFRGRAYAGAGIFAALAILARPECVLLFGLLPLLYLVAERGRGKWRGDLLRLIVPGLAVMALWAIWSLSVAGRILPNTFYAKSQEGDFLDPTEFYGIVGAVWDKLPVAAAVAIAVLTLAGIVRIAFAGGEEGTKSTSPKGAKNARRGAGSGSLFSLVLVLFGVGFLFAVCASREMPDGSADYYYWWRYLVPALPALWIPAALGLDWLSRPGLTRAVRIGVVAVGCAAALLACGGQLAHLKSMADTFAWNCQNINEVQVELGRWINTKTPPDATVAVNDAGATRYFGHRKTIDLYCLNRHEGLDEMDRKAAFPQLHLQKKARWLFEHKVDFLVVFPCWFPDVDIAAMQGRPVYASGGPGALTCSFLILDERRSDHFTITKAPPPGKIGQNLKRAYQCVYR